MNKCDDITVIHDQGATIQCLGSEEYRKVHGKFSLRRELLSGIGISQKSCWKHSTRYLRTMAWCAVFTVRALGSEFVLYDCTVTVRGNCWTTCH